MYTGTKILINKNPKALELFIDLYYQAVFLTSHFLFGLFIGDNFCITNGIGSP